MSIDEAISLLETHTQYYVPVDDLQAFNMALSALRKFRDDDGKEEDLE